MAEVTLCPLCPSVARGSTYETMERLRLRIDGRAVGTWGSRERVGPLIRTGTRRQEMKIGGKSFGRRYAVHAAGDSESHEAR